MGHQRVHPRGGVGCCGKSLTGWVEEEADLARELGVTVRELNGWSPSTVTVNADGDVVSVSVAEPRFTPKERALLLLSRRNANAPRGRHGHLISDATNPDLRGEWQIDTPTRDFVQEKINKEQAAYRKKWGESADMDSLLWRASRRPSQR